jgi:hypothetical protein
MKNLTLLAVAVMTISFQAFSSDFDQIQSIEVYEVNEDNNLVVLNTSNVDDLQGQEVRKPNKGIGNALMVGRELIAFGKEIYKIIEAGKPVVSVGELTPVSILPKNELGVRISSFDLEGWKEPRAKKYRVVAKNGFGYNMISFEFMIMFSYGGSYDGKGAFIADAEISATDVEVSWGYNLAADFKVKSILNQGSKENPVAATVLQISYTMKTVLKETKSTKKFLVNGLGKIRAY